MATVCGQGGPANSRTAGPGAASQIFTEFTGYSAAATCFPSGLNATAVNPLELTKSSSPGTLLITPPVAIDHRLNPPVQPWLVPPTAPEPRPTHPNPPPSSLHLPSPPPPNT